MLRKIVLLGHSPNEETRQQILKVIGGDVIIFTYSFHVDQLKDIHKAVVGLLMNINEQVDLESADEIIIGAPGLSSGSFLIPDAIRGLTGKSPKLLNMIKVSGNRHIPCPENPVVDCERLYAHMRRKRRVGVVACSAS